MRAADGKKRTIVRVRTGCSTCKIRRVKCDEAKPACMKCSSTGRTCDGYAIPAARSTAFETTTFYSIPFRVPGSQYDRQLLHYYCMHAARDLSGYSVGSPDFWSGVALQQAHHEPVLQHALVAVAAVHRDQVLSELPSNVPGSHTMNAYNKAVRQLRKYLSLPSPPNPVVLLICCMLFYCFESARGEYDWALRHLQTGLEMIQSRGIAHLPESLVSIFKRLDLQTSVFNVGRAPFLSLASATQRIGALGGAPSSFRDLYEAQDTLDVLQNWMLHYLISNIQYKFTDKENCPPGFIREGRALESELIHWARGFDKLIATRPVEEMDPSPEAESRLLVLRVWRMLCCMIILSGWPNVVSEPAPTQPKFQEILEALKTLINHQQKTQNESFRRSFSSEMSILPPLLVLIVKCKGSKVRKHAFALLSSLRRREGLLDTHTMVQVIEKVMNLEKGGSKFPMDEDGWTLEEWGVDAADAGRGEIHRIAVVLGTPRQVSTGGH